MEVPETNLEFFNALYFRASAGGGRGFSPASFGRGGISQYFFWYPNLDNQNILRTSHDIQGFSACGVGSVFPFRDIMYVKIGVNATEDPKDGVRSLDVCMCSQAYEGLKASGVAHDRMPYGMARDMRAVFERFSEHQFGQEYKKELHTWLRQKHRARESQGNLEILKEVG
jgi:hypothetical protein